MRNVTFQTIASPRGIGWAANRGAPIDDDDEAHVQVGWISAALRAVRDAGLQGKALRAAQWQIFVLAKGERGPPAPGPAQPTPAQVGHAALTRHQQSGPCRAWRGEIGKLCQ